MSSGPPLAEEVVPVRRPHTIVPSVVMEVHHHELAALTDEQLIAFADQQLSLVFPPGTSRGTILTKIVNASLVVADVPEVYPVVGVVYH